MIRKLICMEMSFCDFVSFQLHPKELTDEDYTHKTQIQIHFRKPKMHNLK